MATETSDNNNGFLYFVVGALVIAVIAFGVIYFNGGFGRSSSDNAIERTADAVGDAADRVADSTRDAARNATNQ